MMRTFLVFVVLSAFATSVISLEEFDGEPWSIGEETVPEFFQDLNMLSEPELTASVDCSDDVQPMGKIRARQGRLCKPRGNQPPTTNPSPSPSPEPSTKPSKKKKPGAGRNTPGWDDSETTEPVDLGRFRDHNAMCVILTRGSLPYAVCDSGKKGDRYLSKFMMGIGGTQTPVPYTLLKQCRLGMLIHYGRDTFDRCNTGND